MDNTTLYITVIVIMLINIQIVTCECGKEVWSETKTKSGRATYIGLFSIISHKDNAFFDYFAFAQVRKLQENFNTFSLPRGYLVSIEVCQSPEVLQKILMRIFLDAIFSDVEYIVSYMPTELTKITASLLGGTNLYYSAYSKYINIPQHFKDVENMQFITPYSESTEGILYYYIGMGVYNLVYIDVCEQEEQCESLTSDFINQYGSKVCIQNQRYVGYKNVSNIETLSKDINIGKIFLYVRLLQK